MKIAGVLSGLGLLTLLSAGACATRHGEQTAAPAASPSNASVTSAPVLEKEPGSPPAAAPAPQGLDQMKSEAAREDEFTTLESAERALNQAKADLDRLAMAEPAPTLGRNAADGAEKKASRRGAPSAAGAAAPTASAPSAQCDNACRAFASLTRAASAVCRLDGDDGRHCSHAKRVVSESERRVASCTCPAPGQ